MRVVIKDTGEMIEAKYWKDMTDEEKKVNDDGCPDIWEDDDIFIDRPAPSGDTPMYYMYDWEVEIVPE